MGSSFVITTRERPNELRACVERILDQSRLPDEIVIVDASANPSGDGLRELAAAAGVRLVYQTSEAGRTRQLNKGVRASSGDPVFFVDDDSKIDPDFHSAMLKTFEATGPDVGGIQAVMTNNEVRAWPVRALRAVFLLSRRTRDSPGRVLRSGYYTIPIRPSAPREAQALWMGATGFRRGVCDEFSFDESLEGPSLGEDIDFSYRVSRRYRLLVTPEARFEHHRAPGGRIGQRERARTHVVNQYRLFRKNLWRGTAWNTMAFAWAMVGRLLSELVKSVARRQPDYILGTIDGLLEIVHRHRSAEPLPELIRK